MPAALLLAAAPAHAEQGRILIGLAVVLVGAKLFGAIVERVGQPAVLGAIPSSAARGPSTRACTRSPASSCRSSSCGWACSSTSTAS